MTWTRMLGPLEGVARRVAGAKAREPYQRRWELLAQACRHAGVFSRYLDLAQFARAVVAFRSGPPVGVRVRSVGHRTLLCRPGTSDAWVLWDTFDHVYHLPPMPLQPECCILDLGANVGYTAAHYAQLFGGARVIAVEMDAGNAQIARQNLAQFGGRCSVVHAAVWSHDGTVEYDGDSEWGFRISKASASAPDGVRTTRALTIDRILDDYGVDRVDYLKVDIEGAEATVLDGPMAWARRVRSIKVEVHPPATIWSCLRALTLAGFRCERDAVHRQCVSGLRAD